MSVERSKKTYVQIYNDVKFVVENHNKLFPTEILKRVDMTYATLKKVSTELNLPLLNIDLADKVLHRAHSKQKRKYRRKRKLSALEKFKAFLNWR